jgi:hypothetical protein
VACYKNGTAPRGYALSKVYTSKEECDEECDGTGTGACTDRNGVCRELRPCRCPQAGAGAGVFSGIGTQCNPLP